MTNKQLELMSDFIHDKVIAHNKKVYESKEVKARVKKELSKRQKGLKMVEGIHELDSIIEGLKQIRDDMVSKLRIEQGDEDLFIHRYSKSPKSPEEIKMLLRNQVAEDLIVKTTPNKIQQHIVMCSDLNSEAIVEVVTKELLGHASS